MNTSALCHHCPVPGLPGQEGEGVPQHGDDAEGEAGGVVDGDGEAHGGGQGQRHPVPGPLHSTVWGAAKREGQPPGTMRGRVGPTSAGMNHPSFTYANI